MKTDNRQNHGEVYFNGRILAHGQARFSAEDYGVLYGLGFFETFRTSGGHPHLWAEHRSRLLLSCKKTGISVPPDFLVRDESKLCHAVSLLLRKYNLPDGVFRYTLTAGLPQETKRGLSYDQPSELLSLRPLPTPSPRRGVALHVLNVTRDNGEWMPRPKSLNYANALLGWQELRQRGAGAGDEGLFLSRSGHHVVEAVRHNVAWVKAGRLCYPDPALGAVAGTCLQWALGLGLRTKACQTGLDDFLRADAILLLNSVRGITPVHAVRDLRDRPLLRSLESPKHPMVIDLIRQWNAALAQTALTKMATDEPE